MLVAALTRVVGAATVIQQSARTPWLEHKRVCRRACVDSEVFSPSFPNFSKNGSTLRDLGDLNENPGALTSLRRADCYPASPAVR